MACKIADVNKKGIEITPIGASSFHATIFEELAATFCSCLLLVEPLVFAWLRIFFKLLRRQKPSRLLGISISSR